MISHNEALERLRDYQKVSETDPESAHLMADSLLIEIIDDEEIKAEFQAIDRHYKAVKYHSDFIP